ncbi:unnamed protein product [Pleuronectes platessa]|uniref:Uncharacterized protein n=1 Tax=Pleuronectes platessa TaxID=8262 RepID=A0A9N7ZFH6_PLEPL|nr:unnamed protein product [Pleuronectes platessa]
MDPAHTPMDRLDKVEAMLQHHGALFLSNSAEVQLAVAKQEQAFTSLASQVQQLASAFAQAVPLLPEPVQPPPAPAASASAFVSEPRGGFLNATRRAAARSLRTVPSCSPSSPTPSPLSSAKCSEKLPEVRTLLEGFWASSSEWNQAAQCDAFLMGLADYIKDELISYELRSTLDGIIELASARPVTSGFRGIDAFWQPVFRGA